MQFRELSLELGQTGGTSLTVKRVRFNAWSTMQVVVVMLLPELERGYQAAVVTLLEPQYLHSSD